MQVEIVKLVDIREYSTNAKLHPQSQIEQIKQSIIDFEFNDPIAIDEDNVIIEGHGRAKAMQELGEEYIPAIRLCHLTEEQKKAYILVHNKLTMETDFDIGIVNLELVDILDIDMQQFGFELPDMELIEPPQEDEEKVSHRETTNRQYNLDLVDWGRVDGYFDMPVIRKTDHIPEDLIGFNYMLTSDEKSAGIHCFVDDYQFQRLWTSPDAYVEKLKEFDCFLSPDFSLYLDMPLAMQVWNIFRSRLIGQYMQDQGIEVIPTVSWGNAKTFQFAFDGIEPGGVVAVSTIGVKRQDESMRIWTTGMDMMIRLLKPSTILVYGGEVEYDYGDIPVRYYTNHVVERMQGA